MVSLFPLDLTYKSLHVGVEHADLLPVRFVFFDELEMAGILLVNVVRGFGLEHHVQRDVETAVVHRAGQFVVENAGGVVDRAFVAGEVFVASGDQRGAIAGRAFVEREEDGRVAGRAWVVEFGVKGRVRVSSPFTPRESGGR
jgi:hypothetical protein